MATERPMWFFIWLAFVLAFLLPPLIYGWGYRSWGPPPYRGWRTRPLAAQREAEAQAAEEATWGWLAAFFWFMFLVAFVWLLYGLIVL